MKRKVHRIAKAGSIENLKLQVEDIIPPNDTEVCIEVHSIGLNFADIFALTGLYSATPKESFIPGLEYSGIILSKGKKVNKFKIGEKIMGVTRFGGYSTHITVSQNAVYPLPKAWNFNEGAGFIAQGMTAYYALIELGNLKNDQTILIHSAAGGVGILANRIAKKFNAYTIGTVGDSQKNEFLKMEKYNSIILRDNSFKENLHKVLDGKNLNLVLECIGGEIFKHSFNALSPMGRIISYGSANFTPKGSSASYINLIKNYLTRPKLDPLAMISENKSVMAFNLIWLWDKIEELNPMLTNLLALKIKPQYIGKIFPFENAIEAINYFKSGKSIGKVVLEV